MFMSLSFPASKRSSPHNKTNEITVCADQADRTVEYRLFFPRDNSVEAAHQIHRIERSSHVAIGLTEPPDGRSIIS